jgi:hypothetical protein
VPRPHLAGHDAHRRAAGHGGTGSDNGTRGDAARRAGEEELNCRLNAAWNTVTPGMVPGATLNKEMP